jgi:hypothetical protein
MLQFVASLHGCIAKVEEKILDPRGKKTTLRETFED